MKLLTADQDARPTDWAIYLLGVAGLTASIALVFLGMRAVMDIGGYCAEGGPYVIETHCPEGVPLIMTLAFPLGFGSAGLMIWRGARIGVRYAGLALVAWPALFLSLGWNFLQYGLDPSGGAAPVWGWLICAVVFIAMGAVPLFVVLRFDSVLRRPAPDAWPKVAAIVTTIVAGILIGYAVFGAVAG